MLPHHYYNNFLHKKCHPTGDFTPYKSPYAHQWVHNVLGFKTHTPCSIPQHVLLKLAPSLSETLCNALPVLISSTSHWPLKYTSPSRTHYKVTSAILLFTTFTVILWPFRPLTVVGIFFSDVTTYFLIGWLLFGRKGLFLGERKEIPLFIGVFKIYFR